MFVNLSAGTADELWLAVVDKFRSGCGTPQDSRSGQTIELLHAALCLEDPRQRWIVSRSPAISPAFALVEVIWILSGRNDAAFLNFFNSRLPNFAGSENTYHGAYGFRLRRHFRIDQLLRAYEVLTKNEDSRQVVLQIWDPKSDLPAPDGSPAAPDVPCNVCSLLKVRGETLEWTQVMRSNDVFRGLPFNLIQFTFLHEIIAGWLGLALGHYQQISDSLHIYEDDQEAVLGTSRAAAPINTDSFASTFSETQQVIAQLVDFVDLAINPDTSPGALLVEFGKLRLSVAWRNVAAIIGAECSRRKHDTASMETFMKECNNATYLALMRRWNDRVMRS